MNRKHIEIFLKTMVGATFFVPLVVMPASYIFPFIVPKILLFRSLVLLMLAGYLLLLSVNWHYYRPRLSSLNIIVGLFFISFCVSTFVGVDWYKSFWDNHERMLGLFTIFHYVIYYLVLTTVIKDKKDWRWLLRVFLGAGALVMFIGVWQKYINPDALLNGGQPRVSATLGNPIYYSGYGLFLFFIGALLALKEKPYSFWSYYAIIGSFLGFIGVFLGGTRGTLLGLVIGFVSLLVSYSILLKGNKKIRTGLVISMVSLVMIGGLLVAFRNTSFVTKIPAVGRLVRMDLSTGSGANRIMSWQIAYDAWKEKPIFGWGPNNFYYAYNKYYNPHFLRQGWGETWFDNAHNVLLNTLAVQGAPGFILYLSLFGFAILGLLKAGRAGKLDVHFTAVSIAFLTAHIIHNIFVFENPTSYLYFFFFLAYVGSQVWPIETEEGAGSRKVSWGLVAFVGIFILLILYSTNINASKANKMSLQTVKAIHMGLIEAEDMYTNTLQSPTPHMDDIRTDVARALNDNFARYYQDEGGSDNMSFFDLVYQGVEKNREIHPLDIRMNIMLAQLDITRGNYYGDMNYLKQAEKVVDEALELSPDRQQLLFMASSIKLQLGNVDDAISLIKKAIEDDPTIPESWWRLAGTYRQAGQVEVAREVIEEAQNEHGIVFSQAEWEKINTYILN